MSDRSTWVEVNVAAMAANLRALQQHVRVPVCAVIKANAYGHGLVGAARALAEAGAAMLGVTRIEEARALRAGGVDAPVLILMPVPDPNEAVALSCDITVGSGDEISSLPSHARVHLKVDTGMGRLGVRPADALQYAREIAKRCTLAAVWTHFADAAGPSASKQLAIFDSVVRALRSDGLNVSAHASNSAAAIAVPAARYDMVRAGTVLYGQNPVGATAPWQLRETFRWYARVAAVRTIPAGATVGYGGEWTAASPTRVATIPVGYTDGFTLEPFARTPSPRELARRLKHAVAATVRDERAVYFGDRKAPVVGRAAMQAITVSLANAPDVSAGSIARIPARRLFVNPEIPRDYVDGAS